MSAFIRLNCPHCSTQNAAMQYQSYWKNPKVRDLHILFYICGICHKGICIELESIAVVHPTSPSFDIFNKEMYCIQKIHPASALRIPSQIPVEIAKIFKQALMTINNPLLADIAGMACRKSLDIAVKVIDKEGKFTGTLYEKINHMYAANLITETIKDWAHRLRLDGNDATHDDFNHKKAKELFNFTEIFFIYVFTLPTLIATAKTAPEAELTLYAPFQLDE